MSQLCIPRDLARECAQREHKLLSRNFSVQEELEPSEKNLELSQVLLFKLGFLDELRVLLVDQWKLVALSFRPFVDLQHIAIQRRQKLFFV